MINIQPNYEPINLIFLENIQITMYRHTRNTFENSHFKLNIKKISGTIYSATAHLGFINTQHIMANKKLIPTSSSFLKYQISYNVGVILHYTIKVFYIVLKLHTIL